MNLQPVFEILEKRAYRRVTIEEQKAKVNEFLVALTPLLILQSDDDSLRVLSSAVVTFLDKLEHERDAQAKEVVKTEATSLAEVLLASYRNLLPHSGAITIQYVDYSPVSVTLTRKNDKIVTAIAS